MKRMIREKGKKLGRFVLVCGAILLLGLTVGCPIRQLTGIPCPGCGMSRAWLCVLQFRFEEAFRYHPLFFLAPLIMVLAFGETLFEKNRRNTRLMHLVLAVVVVSMLAVYVYRIFPGHSSVVRIELENGLIYRGIRILMDVLK